MNTKIIYEVGYIPTMDTTVIFKSFWNIDTDTPIRQDVIGFHFGEPLVHEDATSEEIANAYKEDLDNGLYSLTAIF